LVWVNQQGGDLTLNPEFDGVEANSNKPQMAALSIQSPHDILWESCRRNGLLFLLPNLETSFCTSTLNAIAEPISLKNGKNFLSVYYSRWFVMRSPEVVTIPTTIPVEVDPVGVGNIAIITA
jgi:hypothetical protein